MKITIRTIQGILISNILFAGLTACSSEPAPWARPDESPWSEKHEMAEQNSAEEVVVVELTTVVVDVVSSSASALPLLGMISTTSAQGEVSSKKSLGGL